MNLRSLVIIVLTGMIAACGSNRNQAPSIIAGGLQFEPEQVDQNQNSCTSEMTIANTLSETLTLLSLSATAADATEETLLTLDAEQLNSLFPQLTLPIGSIYVAELTIPVDANLTVNELDITVIVLATNLSGQVRNFTGSFSCTL